MEKPIGWSVLTVPWTNSILYVGLCPWYREHTPTYGLLKHCKLGRFYETNRKFEEYEPFKITASKRRRSWSYCKHT